MDWGGDRGDMEIPDVVFRLTVGWRRKQKSFCDRKSNRRTSWRGKWKRGRRKVKIAEMDERRTKRIEELEKRYHGAS